MKKWIWVVILVLVVLLIAFFIFPHFISSRPKLESTAHGTEMVSNPATPDSPLTADREVLLNREHPESNITISVYNGGTTKAEGVNIIMSKCVSSNGTELDSDDYRLKIMPQNIESNTYIGYKAIIEFNKSALSGINTIVCKLTAQNSTGGWYTGKPSTAIVFIIQ